MAIIGTIQTLRITRHSMPGHYLDGGELGEVLLPQRGTPPGTHLGDELDVFVYRDSDGRLLATVQKPFVVVGGLAVLRVTGLLRDGSARLDWGIDEPLLLPVQEQEVPVMAGEEVVVTLFAEPVSQQLFASTRLAERLGGGTADYKAGQPVDLFIVRDSPLGYICAVNGRHLGLLYHQEGQALLKPGDKVQGYIGTLRNDGKLDLTLDSSGRHAVMTLADQILEALRNNGGRLELDDDSSPEDIRATFNTSKKAFKQALGALFRERRIMFTKPGIELARRPQNRVRTP